MGKFRSNIPVIIFYIALAGLIIFFFFRFSMQNLDSIEQVNREHASQALQQAQTNLADRFNAASELIGAYAYMLGQNLDKPDVPAAAIREIEARSQFNRILYVTTRDAASRGLVGDMKDSGTTVNLSPSLFAEPAVGFYAPVRYGDKVIGRLEGVYLAGEALHQMLQTSHAGAGSALYLCDANGAIIASTLSLPASGNVLDYLVHAGAIGEKTAAAAGEAILQGQNAALTCAEGYAASVLCAGPLAGYELLLVQTFSEDDMILEPDEAEDAGLELVASLLALFICVAAFLLMRSRLQKRSLEQRNRELRLVTEGMNILFSGRFLAGNFDTDEYVYFGKSALRGAGIATHGAYADLFSLRRAEMPHAGDREEFENIFNSVNLRKELTRHDTVSCICRVMVNEREEWENITGICLSRRDGEPVDFMVVRQNVTDMKKREIRAQQKIADMNRKERQYQLALTTNAFASYEFNVSQDELAEDVVCAANGQQISLQKERGLGVPCKASEFLQSWQPLLLPESVDDYNERTDIAFLRRKFYEGTKEVELDFWLHNHLGQELCLRQSFYLASDELTGDVMAMTVMRDITAHVVKQRSQTKALQDALLLAQHANEAKTTFLSNMSHDIRTPMNAIIGFSTIAASHLDNKNQVRDCLQKVLSSSNHLLSLINDILDMSRIESGKLQIKEQPCNISELMHNIVTIIQPQVKAKQMQLYIETFDVINEDIITDPLKLNQVFINLLGNAVKYTPSGGRISFSMTQKPAFRHGYADYVFEVADNGIGMTPEFVQHIFEPFTRETTTTQSGIQGTGLGMAITKNIIEMMNGHIEVQSEPGKGSTFIVTLTLKLQDGAHNQDDIKALEGMRALVVDDDFHVCDSVSKMLRKIGLRPEWTTSGREAVYRAQLASEEEDPFHTYIIDWQMPEMNGVETARKIREKVGSKNPIIILTAYEWADIEEEARQIGVTAFCAKPLFMSDLRNALLGSHNLGAEPAAEAEAREKFTDARILLVDDLEMNREVAEFILEENGFKVESAPDGTDAVEMVRQAPEGYYDAILMDVQMPTMNGYEATRAIRNLDREDVKELPIIAMTANALEEDRALALQSGMNDHIAKPIDMKNFYRVLGKYFGSK